MCRCLHCERNGGFVTVFMRHQVIGGRLQSLRAQAVAGRRTVQAYSCAHDRQDRRIKRGQS